MRILGDFFRWIASVVDQNFLGRDENADGGFESFDVERAVLAFELHQVQRSQIASGIVQENVFRARIGGMNRFGAFAGMPFLNGAVILKAWVAADPGAFGDFV